MEKSEIQQLFHLLDKFVEWDTKSSSLYGRNMDKSLATSLQCALPAYGLQFNLKLTLYNGEVHYKRGYISKNAAIHVGNSLLNTCGEDGNEFTSQVVKYELV